MHIPMFGCWMCRWWWNPLWFCMFLFTHIYIYMYTYILSSRFFVAQFGLYQTWANLGTIQNCTGFLCREQKVYIQFSMPVIMENCNMWDDNDFCTIRHSDHVRAPSDGIPLRGRISLCLQDASLGGGNLEKHRGPSTILEGPLHRDRQCYTGRED